MTGALVGKRIVVTGAGGGIGRATARLVAARGAHVACLDLAAVDVKETVRLIQWEKPDAEIYAEVLDCTDFDHASQVVSSWASRWDGRIDALINVAGVIQSKPLAQCELVDLERSFKVNVGAMLVMSRAVLPMLPRGGVIVNVSSSNAQTVTLGLGLYGASKAANVYLTRALAAEFAERDIRVCGVGPGAVDTEMPRSILPEGPEGERTLALAVKESQLIHRLAQPEEIASAIGYLISDEASYITGSTLWIDGGASATH